MNRLVLRKSYGAKVSTIMGLAIAGMLTSGCARSLLPFASLEPAPVGEWRGTTAQGTPIAFSVNDDEIVTTITLGYDFNGCSGTQVFTDVNAPTAPNVICLPGPCSGRLASSYRHFGYVDGAVGTGPSTQINGLFLPGDRAEGQVVFRDYAGCGEVPPVTWTATKR